MSRNRRSPNEFRFNIKGLFCIYCGEPASQRDHFPPYSACLGGFLLPCCGECNRIAGTEYPFDFAARARHVRNRLEAKYRRLVDTPEWSRDELRSLGFTLRSSVKSWDQRRKLILGRLNWDAMAYLAMLPAARDFVTLTQGLEGDPERQQMAFRKRFGEYATLNAA